MIIYPDDGVFRVIRKIVRGLAYHHWSEVIPDSLFYAEIFKYVMPRVVDEFEQGFNQVHPATFRYWCEKDETGMTHVGWFLSIYRTRNFIVWTFDSENQKAAWLKNRANERD